MKLPGASPAPKPLHNGRAKSALIDLGIEVLALTRKPGSQWTLEEIAIFVGAIVCEESGAAGVGCSDTAILDIERTALRKLRKQAVSLGLGKCELGALAA